MRLFTSGPAVATLLVVESGARPSFQATRYSGALDTAVVVQQPGESTASLHGRIRRAAWLFERTGTPLTTVALLVNPAGHHERAERRSTALALLELLPPDDSQLLLVADSASPSLRGELMALVGALIERDGVRHPIAVEFDARHVAPLRAAAAAQSAQPRTGESPRVAAQASFVEAH